MPAGGRPSQPQRFYVEQLATMKERELKCLYVNYEHLAEYDMVRGRRRAGGRAAISLSLQPHSTIFCSQRQHQVSQSSITWPDCPPPCSHSLPRAPSPALHAHRPPSTIPPPPRPRPPQSLSANISEAYYRLEPFLRTAVRAFVRHHLDAFAENEDGSDKQFWISFYNLPDNDRLRALRSARIGKLSQFVGTVTRTTDVRPELFTGTFRCMQCMTGAWRGALGPRVGRVGDGGYRGAALAARR